MGSPGQAHEEPQRPAPPAGLTPRAVHGADLAHQVRRVAHGYAELAETLDRIADDVAGIGRQQGLSVRRAVLTPAAVPRAIRYTESNINLESVVTAAAVYERSVPDDSTT
jgi:hypothetical protein